MTGRLVAAVDLGASSGRVMVGRVASNELELTEVHRFTNDPARTTLLCQLTADACEVPVLAGPVEATALGNVLVQARARGLLAGDLETLRALIRATQDIRRFESRTAVARRGH